MADRQLPSPEVLRQLLSYDPDTGLLTWKKRNIPDWDNRFAGKHAFMSKAPRGYLCGRVNYVSILAQRAIWALHYGFWPDAQVDHKNGIRHDNRLVNLRLATPSQNQCNRIAKPDAVSTFRGVIRERQGKPWRARIKIGGKTISLGRFDDEVAAACAYDAASIKHHGEFGLLNFPR